MEFERRWLRALQLCLTDFLKRGICCTAVVSVLTVSCKFSDRLDLLLPQTAHTYSDCSFSREFFLTVNSELLNCLQTEVPVVQARMQNWAKAAEVVLQADLLRPGAVVRPPQQG